MDPDYIEATRLTRQGRHSDALPLFRVVVERRPEDGNVRLNYGVALQGLLHFDEALQQFDEAIRLMPDNFGGYLNRGVALDWVGRHEEALVAFQKAVDLSPGNPHPLRGRSDCYRSLRRHQEAIADCNTILAMDPGDAKAHWSKAISLLSLGDYDEGFREHEWRFGTPFILGPHRFPQPLWRGEETEKRILFWHEQGLGDSLQFCRYLHDMKHLDWMVEVPQSLERLFRENFDAQVIVRGSELPPFDLHCPLMSIAPAVGTTVDNVPRQFPYLWPSEDEVERWREVLYGTGRFRVGLAWCPGIRPDQPSSYAMGLRRTIPKELLEPLRAIPGVGWVSLQKEMPPDGWVDWITDPMPGVKDMADTAGIIANLDLVIAVDSAVAHLAAAMGKSTWVISRWDICWRWRWLGHGVDSPWYPHAQVIVPDKPRDWPSVIRQIEEKLRRVHADRRETSRVHSGGDGSRDHDLEPQRLVSGH